MKEFIWVWYKDFIIEFQQVEQIVVLTSLIGSVIVWMIPENGRFIFFLSQNVEEEELQELMDAAMSMSGDLEFRDDGYIELVLRILGLMCDNQHHDIQVQ